MNARIISHGSPVGRCLELGDDKKQAKLQWLQDASKINVANLNNIRCEAISGIKRRNI
jgi:hypothetical protein